MDAAARTLFLEAICQGDKALFADIEAEIEAREAAPVVDTPVEEAADALPDDPEIEAAPLADTPIEEAPPVVEASSLEGPGPVEPIEEEVSEEPAPAESDLGIDDVTMDAEPEIEEEWSVEPAAEIPHVISDEPSEVEPDFELYDSADEPSRFELPVQAVLASEKPVAEIDTDDAFADDESTASSLDTEHLSFESDIQIDEVTHVADNEVEDEWSAEFDVDVSDDQPIAIEAEVEQQVRLEILEDSHSEDKGQIHSEEYGQVPDEVADASSDLKPTESRRAWMDDTLDFGGEPVLDDSESEPGPSFEAQAEPDSALEPAAPHEPEVDPLAEVPSEYAPPVEVQTAPDPEPPPVPTVGRYRLIQEIGRGMTTRVYLGERDDLDSDERVAVKLTDPGVGADVGEERFLFEGNALAALEHPNIVQLIDGGVSEDGRIYIVTKHVSGRPIDRFADDRKLDQHSRLALFHDVCRVVHFGHQRLVIHRDLNPSNVLVLENGDLRLLDFGISKLLKDLPSDAADTDDVDQVDEATVYASPEQRRGDPLTTVSDVYSLGALLYRLLTGRTPKSITRRTEITGQSDLDAIIFKALREDPAVRYGSAESLMNDIRRFLDGRPVEAHPGSFGYRFGKAVKRRKVAFGAATAVFVTALGFAAAMALGLVVIG